MCTLNLIYICVHIYLLIYLFFYLIHYLFIWEYRGYILGGMHIQVDLAKWSKTTFRLTWAMLRVYSGWGMVCYATCLGVLRNPLHVSNLSTLKVSRLLVTYDIGFRNIFELCWCLRISDDIQNCKLHFHASYFSSNHDRLITWTWMYLFMLTGMVAIIFDHLYTSNSFKPVQTNQIIHSW
jgi:hypothetical protein